jgi:nicotinamidase-related amidase
MALSSTAVFVIDIQRDLVGDAKTEIPHSARIQDAGAKILAAVRELNASSLAKPALLVFVQHEEQPETGPLVKGSEPWELFFNPIADSKHEILVSKTTRLPPSRSSVHS